jgi:tetratricopeptide (TPR) repeat protein
MLSSGVHAPRRAVARAARAALLSVIGASLLALAASRGAAASPKHAGLPRLASTALPAPNPGALLELDAALALVASARSEEQEAGLARLKDGGAALLPAMSRRLAELRKSANRETVGVLITEARKSRGRKGDDDGDHTSKKKKKSDRGKHDDRSGKAEGDAEGWLPLVLARPHAGDAAYKDLVTVLAIERALVDIGTTPAVRELINVYIYFGDLFRIDVQHMMNRLGDRAVPALIEARKHDADKVRRWASRQLDAIGKAVPGETVQIPDQEVLADVLRAYGRTKEIDALRVVVSFTSSDRLHVREAAREALVAYGEAALWQLREAYESLTGKRPPAGQTWDQLERELFEAHDRARLEEIIGLFEEGLAHHKGGKLDEMAQAFDSVLARAPTFERRGEMIDGYLELAHKLEEKDRGRALLYARKALRLDPADPRAKSTEGYVLTLEADDLLAGGLVDTAAYTRALEADPTNERARTTLARVEQNPRVRAQGNHRYLAAAVIAFIAVAAAFVIGIWPKPPPDPLGPPDPPGPPEPPAPPEASEPPEPAEPPETTDPSESTTRPDPPDPTGLP